MLPSHLKRYIVSQDYGRYTPVDQAIWRYIMRQLVSFLSVNAHECYREGLKKAGIMIDRIPQIDEMGKKLSEFGWVTVPVSGEVLLHWGDHAVGPGGSALPGHSVLVALTGDDA